MATGSPLVLSHGQACDLTLARKSPVPDSMLCILHAWLLEGSGSNLWTRAVVQSLCRKGETVHLVCQENHPERYGFISAAITHRLDGSSETTLSRETPFPGKCILHKPELGATLPVFVWDKYEEYSRVVPMVDLPTSEIESYVGTNVRVVRRLVEDEKITAIHANHAVMMPVVAQRIREALGIPYTVMPHGSDIEYAVKEDERFLNYATEAFIHAGKIFVHGEEMEERVLKVFQGVPDLAEKLVELRLGVDTSDFELVSRHERDREIDLLLSALSELPRGKTAAQEAAMEKRLPEVRDIDSLRTALQEASRYDGKRPDARAGEKLRTIEWASAPTLVFVGRLIAWKGIQSLIAALPFALEKEPNLRTIVVGHGPLREAMEAMVWALREGRRDLVELIATHGRAIDGSADPGASETALADVRDFYSELEREGELDNNFALAQRVLRPHSVVFTGYLTHTELRHLFPCCDVGVFPSVVRESGPMVFLEALASGCFPLGTYFGGMKASIDALREDLPPEISEIMKLDRNNAVRDLTQKIPLAVQKSERYRETLARVARENYDWSSVAKIFLRAVNGLEAPRVALGPSKL
ncbi:MAG: glycosyltransferase family 4 protein [Gemmatimonadota bacterium]|nr:glycosyltransferase family 4 protein [Gemmatimonadota bacterium]